VDAEVKDLVCPGQEPVKREDRRGVDETVDGHLPPRRIGQIGRGDPFTDRRKTLGFNLTGRETWVGSHTLIQPEKEAGP
jgi:hypothetical protein